MTDKMGWIRQHAEQSFRNDLCCGLNYPTPNPFTGKNLPEYEDYWQNGYDKERMLCEQMSDNQTAREVEDGLREAGVG